MEENEIKEAIKALGKLKEEFINDKIVSENFTEEQKGMIKVWLDEAYSIGKSAGKTESVCNNEDFSKYMQAIEKLITTNSDGDNDWIWKNMIMFERNINALQSSEVSTLLYMIDKEKFGMAWGTCPKI